MRLAYAGAPDRSPEACLGLYRRLAAGVTLVTTCGPDGEPLGLTASAVTTVSLDPPMMLACLSAGSGTLAALRTRRAFAIHLLRADQAGLATVFAGAGGPGKFAGVEFQWELGIPVLRGTLGWVACTLADERVYGDHSVVVGNVVSVRGDGDGTAEGEPLIWHDRRFRELAPEGDR
ncbi:flavin reductase family protein [Kitasatospora sp. NPDC048239]|uniref:flavin reductase family protein n=1 Tax=unclassified Kitasatospora TaxID=2633591 RepID=UPI0036DBB1EE